MAIIGYVRVSTGAQTVENQKLAVHEAKYHPDEWYEVSASTRKSSKHRRIDELLNRVNEGDVVVVAELSRLARSVGQIAIITDSLIKKGVGLHCLKEDIKIGAGVKPNMQTKVMTTMFSLFGEIERDLISERTKEGLDRAVAEGKTLGRPAGKIGKSKLDNRREEIQKLLDRKVGVASIAKICDCSWPAMDNFIKSRNLKGNKP